MIRFVLFVFITLMAGNCIAQQGQTLDLYIMAGQSNLFGWAGDARDYPKDDHGIDARTKFYYVVPDLSLQPSASIRQQGVWTSMGPQIDGRFPAGHFGPEVSFSRKLSTEGRIAIFKYSKGGSSLAEDWLAPGANGLYDGMAKQLKSAIGDLEHRGFKVKIKGIVWIQGESDAVTPVWAAKYKNRLTDILDDLTNNVVRAHVPIVLGLDEAHPFVLGNPAVISTQESLAESYPCTARSSMVGLEKADVSHLKPSAIVLHGESLYNALLEARRRCEK